MLFCTDMFRQHPEAMWCSRCRNMDFGSLLFTGRLWFCALPTAAYKQWQSNPLCCDMGPSICFRSPLSLSTFQGKQPAFCEQ